MVAFNPSRIFALWHTKNTQVWDCVATATLTVPDFKPTELLVEKVNGDDPLSSMTVMPSDQVYGGMDDYGARCAIIRNAAPSGLGIFDLRGSKSISFRYFHVSP